MWVCVDLLSVEWSRHTMVVSRPRDAIPCGCALLAVDLGRFGSVGVCLESVARNSQ